LTKLRRTFYSQIERASFRTAWGNTGRFAAHTAPAARRRKRPFEPYIDRVEAVGAAEVRVMIAGFEDLRPASGQADG
jgi:hypothetical protein